MRARYRSNILILGVALSFLVSLYLKHPAVGQNRGSDASGRSQMLHQLTEVLAVQDIIYHQTIKPVNRGNFDIQIFQDLYCDGVLALIALEKNEEGASILAHYLKVPVTDIKFILADKIYAEFPAITYWFHSLYKTKASNHVIAVKEYGDCRMIDQIDWSKL